MSLYTAPAGLVDPLRGTLTGTSNTSVLTAGAAERILLPKIRIANTTGSSVTIDVEINNGTQYYLLFEYPIVANFSIELFDEMLLPGEILKLKAGTGSSAIDYHVYFSVQGVPVA